MEIRIAEVEAKIYRMGADFQHDEPIRTETIRFGVGEIAGERILGECFRFEDAFTMRSYKLKDLPLDELREGGLCLDFGNTREGVVIDQGEMTKLLDELEITVEDGKKPMPATPELERQAILINSGQASLIQEFIDWIAQQDWAICAQREHSNTGAYDPIMLPPQVLMAKFFEIDLNKIEQERRALLEHIRN